MRNSGDFIQNSYRKLGVHIPEILLPAKGTNLKKWSVIACDQYTSQPEYWQKVNEEVGDSPSTLRLTFPEIYLKDDNKEERIIKINETMARYLEQGVFEKQKPGFILVDRSTPHTASRKGLILAVDLECYDYRVGSQTLIRATEGTVLDRIPPRVKIRENAPIELPHIMLLIDDPDRTVIEPLFEKTSKCEKLYDFELMQGGGHIYGWKIDNAESLALVANALGKLAGPHTACAIDSDASPEADVHNPLLFAVGDGNHSLASAKAHWENVKATLNHQSPSAGVLPSSDRADVPEHPARYALVEVVNVHDDGLVFEPIHRVLFGVDNSLVLKNIKNICNSYAAANQSEITLEYTLYDSRTAMEAELKAARNTSIAAAANTAVETANTIAATANTTDETANTISTTANTIATTANTADETANTAAAATNDSHLLPFILEGTYGILTVKNPMCSLEVGTLQSILDELAKRMESIEIDYIHGEQVVTELGSQKSCMGFFLPVMDKRDLFKTVKQDGVLPRKTFSMGEAEEKRYYLECRCISKSCVI